MSKLVTEKDALLAAFPYSLTRDDDKEKLADAIAEELIKTIAESEYAAVFPRVDELPEEVLDILAADLKIQWYETDASISNKRNAVKECMLVHKYKGTKYAVETVLRGMFNFAEVKEWFDYNGSPYHFKVIIYDTSGDQSKRERTLEKIKYYKNIRSVLEETIFKTGIKSEVLLVTKICAGSKYKRIKTEVLNNVVV